jgi:hypothetical protein
MYNKDIEEQIDEVDDEDYHENDKIKNDKEHFLEELHEEEYGEDYIYELNNDNYNKPLDFHSEGRW